MYVHVYDLYIPFKYRVHFCTLLFIPRTHMYRQNKKNQPEISAQKATLDKFHATFHRSRVSHSKNLIEGDTPSNFELVIWKWRVKIVF